MIARPDATGGVPSAPDSCRLGRVAVGYPRAMSIVDRKRAHGGWDAIPVGCGCAKFGGGGQAMGEQGATNGDDLDRYRPRIAWWARPHGAAGIHGLGHCARVLLWADHVAQRLAATECGRSDGGPLGRRLPRLPPARRRPRCQARNRAAQWSGKNAALLDPTLSTDQVKAVQWAVTWHVPPDAECPRWTPELRCLKDADGLDRVRLGDFDAAYLRLPYLHGREQNAMALLQASPYGSVDPWETIRAAAREILPPLC